MAQEDLEELRLLSVDDLVDLFGIPKRTIYKWSYEGTIGLPFIRIGRHLRFRPAEVAAFLKSHEKAAG